MYEKMRERVCDGEEGALRTPQLIYRGWCAFRGRKTRHSGRVVIDGGAAAVVVERATPAVTCCQVERVPTATTLCQKESEALRGYGSSWARWSGRCRSQRHGPCRGFRFP